MGTRKGFVHLYIHHSPCRMASCISVQVLCLTITWNKAVPCRGDTEPGLHPPQCSERVPWPWVLAQNPLVQRKQVSDGFALWPLGSVMARENSPRCFSPVFRSIHRVVSDPVSIDRGIQIQVRSRLDTVSFAKCLKYLRGLTSPGLWSVVSLVIMYMHQRLLMQTVSLNGWKPGRVWSLVSLLIAGIEAPLSKVLWGLQTSHFLTYKLRNWANSPSIFLILIPWGLWALLQISWKLQKYSTCLNKMSITFFFFIQFGCWMIPV